MPTRKETKVAQEPGCELDARARDDQTRNLRTRLTAVYLSGRLLIRFH
jgi:hypothetical protein